MNETFGFALSVIGRVHLVSDGGGSFTEYFDLEDFVVNPFDPLDDLDALILWDEALDTVTDPLVDFALFSIGIFSPSAYTYTRFDYIPAVLGHMSPADVLWTNFDTRGLYAPAAALGLRSDDELDALDVPAPLTLTLMAVGLVGMRLSRAAR